MDNFFLVGLTEIIDCVLVCPFIFYGNILSIGFGWTNIGISIYIWMITVIKIVFCIQKGNFLKEYAEISQQIIDFNTTNIFI